MTHPNLERIDRFFAAYANRDVAGLHQVLAENVRWIFPGQHPLSGTRTGIDQVVAFFDDMGKIMGASHIQAEQLVTGVNDHYVSQCQHVWTGRADGHNMDVQWCVLWKFENGKIAEGRHLASDQYVVDEFFTHVSR